MLTLFGNCIIYVAPLICQLIKTNGRVHKWHQMVCTFNLHSTEARERSLLGWKRVGTKCGHLLWLQALLVKSCEPRRLEDVPWDGAKFGQSAIFGSHRCLCIMRCCHANETNCILWTLCWSVVPHTGCHLYHETSLLWLSSNLILCWLASGINCCSLDDVTLMWLMCPSPSFSLHRIGSMAMQQIPLSLVNYMRPLSAILHSFSQALISLMTHYDDRRNDDQQPQLV